MWLRSVGAWGSTGLGRLPTGSVEVGEGDGVLARRQSFLARDAGRIEATLSDLTIGRDESVTLTRQCVPAVIGQLDFRPIRVLGIRCATGEVREIELALALLDPGNARD